MRVIIIDLGIGNIHSLSSALRFLGAIHVVSADPAVIRTATHLILPGVGAFNAAMREINCSGLGLAILEHARVRRKPLLGVCLGMQVLFEGSEEGDLPGLGLLPGRFVKLASNPVKQLKVPHVGFASVYGYRPTALFRGLGSAAEFYFTHSFAMMVAPAGTNVGYCDHCQPFVAAFENSNVCGAQFHPEKSQSNGLRFLSNFLET